MTDLERLDEALDYRDQYRAEFSKMAPGHLDVLADAARAYRDLLANGAEPDYAAAAREYARTKYPNIKAIVDAAVGDHLVIPVDGEESG